MSLQRPSYQGKHRLDLIRIGLPTIISINIRMSVGNPKIDFYCLLQYNFEWDSGIFWWNGRIFFPSTFCQGDSRSADLFNTNCFFTSKFDNLVFLGFIWGKHPKHSNFIRTIGSNYGLFPLTSLPYLMSLFTQINIGTKVFRRK